MHSADIIVIGAGIAGVSAASELAASASVLVIEMEPQPGYHATGRSAAFFAPAYGNKVVRGITAASEHFFRSPPEGFSDVDLIRPRDCLFIAREDQQQQLEEMHADNSALQLLSANDVSQCVPILSKQKLCGALRDNFGGDLDVDAVLQGYLRLFRRRGGTLLNGQAVKTMQRVNGSWRIHTDKAEYTAPIIINAAGAWADNIAEIAALAALGIIPKRRTALLIDAPDDMDISQWPLTVDVDEQFYFKPDAGQLLISPADETPSPPCDAQADELDVAVAVDRFENATGLEVRHINHRWAGLRSFAPDKTFVVGFDPRSEGFFWLAGQGGYGVQSAPAMAQLTTALVTGAQLSKKFASVLDYRDAVAPQRLLNES
ncbi:MAG: D-arginine dehydrogenase [Planctomycetota bacterium]|jgi:D-arginine dehydrogenase